MTDASHSARRGQQRPRGPRIDPPITTQPSDGRGSVEQPSSDARRRRHVRWAYRRMTLRHLRRWWGEQCARCGRRPFWSESMILAPGAGRFHDACHAAWRSGMLAEERMRVLEVVTEVWEVDGRTVQELLALRARAELADESNARNLGWRVFYDLENRRKREAESVK